MKVTALIKTIIVALVILAMVAIFFTVLSDRANAEKTEAYETRHVLTVALHQFQTASEALSRLSRSWVIVTTTQYDSYWEEINVTDRIGAATHTFREHAPPEIIFLLNELAAHSDELRRIEALAFDAMRVHDGERAFGYIYSLEYSAVGLEVTHSLNRLHDALLSHTQQLMDSAAAAARLFSRLSNIAWILFAVISVSGTVYILRAVTAAMERERESEARTRSLVEVCPLAVSLYDTDWNELSCNPACIEMFGLDETYAFGNKTDAFMQEIQPDGRHRDEVDAECHKKLLETGYAHVEIVSLKADGTPMILETTYVRLDYGGHSLFAAYYRDLTEERAIREREREANELNEIFKQNAPIVMNIWDDATNLISTSPHAVRMFGLDSIEQYTERFFDLSPEYQPCGMSSREKSLMYNRQAFDEGIARFEWAHQSLDGEPIPSEIILQRFMRGDKPYLVAFSVDLRPARALQQREADKAVRQRLTAMLNASPLACFVLSGNFEVLDLNREAISLFGAKDKRDFIENFIRTAPEVQQDGEPSAKKMYELMSSSMEYIRTEWTAQTFQGEQFPCELHATRFFDDGAKMVIVHMRDLRDFYAYKEMSERIQIMFDTTPLIIEYWDENCMPLDCNKANLDFFGLSKEQYKQYIEEIRFNPPIPGNIGDSHRNGWDANIKRIFATGFDRFDWTEPLPDGTNVPLEVEGYRMMLNNEPIVVTYSRDVTELRELQKEQQRAKIAEESSRAKTMFLANMSHEIRTPINSILGYSELALGDEISEITHGRLDKIIINTKLLLGIVNDVLDLSKIESGILQIEQTPFNFRELLEHCRSMLEPMAAVKGIDLIFNAELPDLDKRRLVGDPTKLSQILLNLLSNAVKFTDEGAVTCSVVKEKADGEDYTLKFIFEDTGIGMTEEHVSRVFEPFVQADQHTTRKYGGTGLGLTITGRMIEAMGGKLQVQSALGEGSVFSFALTFKTVEGGAGEDDSADDEEIAKPNFAGGDVLVVDDNNMNLNVACEHLQRVGLSPFIAKNGRDAVEIVEERANSGEAMFDLIFMDIHMPVMDGKEAARAISDMNLGVPIVAMTAETFASGGETPYLEYGMADYLSKPFTAQQLWRCLLKHLQGAV